MILVVLSKLSDPMILRKWAVASPLFQDQKRLKIKHKISLAPYDSSRDSIKPVNTCLHPHIHCPDTTGHHAQDALLLPHVLLADQHKMAAALRWGRGSSVLQWVWPGHGKAKKGVKFHMHTLSTVPQGCKCVIHRQVLTQLFNSDLENLRGGKGKRMKGNTGMMHHWFPPELGQGGTLKVSTAAGQRAVSSNRKGILGLSCIRDTRCGMGTQPHSCP